jgi:Leucine-rich repeat (LRR) protein
MLEQIEFLLLHGEIDLARILLNTFELSEALYNKYSEVIRISNLSNFTDFLDIFTANSVYIKINSSENIPEELFNLINITELHFWNCCLSDISPSIKKLIKLHTLWLSNNKFTTIPNVVCELQNLKKLHFGGNQITHIPNELNNLVNLEELGLGHNQISVLFLNSMMKLSKLKNLYLSDNLLTRKQIRTLYNINNRIKIIHK